MTRHYLVFSGSRYHGPTANTYHNAKKFGADRVIVADDVWLWEAFPEYKEATKFLWDRPDRVGVDFFSFKPKTIYEIIRNLPAGDVVLFTDADTYPIHDLSVVYETAERDNLMLFASNGWLQKQWCTRACFRLMGIADDDPKYYEAPHGVARFMAFKAGVPSNLDFLQEWLRYCLTPGCNTFDLNPADVQHKDFRQHRCEQAILTNLAHKYGHKLYREACQFGNTFPEDKDLYPQLFTQIGDYSFSPTPCRGSFFRNV